MTRPYDSVRQAIDPWRVVFLDPEQERQYRQIEFERTLWMYRWAIFAGALIHITGALIHTQYLEISQHGLREHVQLMWLIRVGIIIPVSALIWLASFRPWFGRHALWLTIGLFVVNGAAMVFGSMQFGSNTILYFASGTVMVLMYAFILLGSRFWLTAFLCLGLVALHVLAISFIDMPTRRYVVTVEVLLFSTLFILMGGHRTAMTSRIAFMVSGLLAKHEGVQAERSRITRDLHDDVAARLLSLVHRVQDPAVQTQARDALGALRHIIYALDDKTPLPLPDLLNELQAQMRERARLHGIEVVWQEPGTLPDVQFGARENINLQRILAEAMSNAIRHCAPARFTVQLWIEAQDLHMHFCNDGAILQTEDWVAGKGTNNIRSRMNEIGGTARWNTTAPATETGNQKCCLELRIPLPAATPP